MKGKRGAEAKGEREREKEGEARCVQCDARADPILADVTALSVE